MIQDTVQRELLKMLARRLPYSPSPDDLGFTAQVMVEDFIRHGLKEGADTDQRLREAFNKLGLGDKWPTPKMVIDALPPPTLMALPNPHRGLTNTFAAVGRRAQDLGIADDPAKAKELFLKFKRKGGMANLVPTEDEEEARKEREAIQEEGK